MKSEDPLSVNVIISTLFEAWGDPGVATITSFMDSLPIDMVNFIKKLTPNVVSDKDPSSYTTVKGAAIICNLDEWHTCSIFAWYVTCL